MVSSCGSKTLAKGMRKKFCLVTGIFFLVTQLLFAHEFGENVQARKLALSEMYSEGQRSCQNYPPAEPLIREARRGGGKALS